MSRFSLVALVALVVSFAPELILALDHESDLHAKRDEMDSLKIFNRKRNAHACIMSIVFIVLLPLGAISIHLPISRIPGLRNSYLVRKVPAIHAPIQILALVMMIGAMALGIKIAKDLDYLSHPVPAHVVIGLFVVCTIILFQPMLGIMQHRHFKRTGTKSVFGYAHRWIGRGAIILGIINNGLGFQLARRSGIDVPTGSFLRNFILAGVLCGIWVGLAAYDAFRPQQSVSAGGKKASFEENTNGHNASKISGV